MSSISTAAQQKKGFNYLFIPYSPSAVGQGTWTYSIDANSVSSKGYSLNSTAADGDNATFESIYLLPGTYQMTVTFLKHTGQGKVDIFLGASKVISALDLYFNGGATLNATSTTTGITISTAGFYSIKLAANGKNAGSSGYAITIQSININQTA